MNSNPPPLRFADQLRGGNPLPRFDADASGAAAQENTGAARSSEAADLPAGEFADEIARRFRLRRIALPELLAAQPLDRKSVV